MAISKPDEVHHQSTEAIQQLTAPFETSKLVLMAYYDVRITSQLTKNIIIQQPYFAKIFSISISSATTDKHFV